MWYLFLIIALSYLAGAIPTSIITGRLLKGIDIRKHGSGNAGATNVFRVLGWKAGVGVALFDMAKGFAASYFISKIGAENVPLDHSLVQIIAGMSATFGHIWTVFAKFKGGKGAATAAGMFFGLAPVTALIVMLVFGTIVITTRYVSLGSITAALSLTVIMLVKKYGLAHSVPDPLMIFSYITTGLILFTHRSNIVRLINGTENRFKKS